MAGSIFVKAYELERVIGKNDRWEAVPYDIAGIFDKSILPYLREENPAQLMTAWDKRIAQQTRMVEFIRAKQAEQVRGDRDEKARIESQQRREQESRGILKDHDEDDFINNTLPSLKWERLVDMYLYVDKVTAAQEMLAFLNENVANRKTMDWLNQLQAMVGDAGSPGYQEPEQAPAAPAAPATPTEPVAPAATTPAVAPPAAQSPRNRSAWNDRRLNQSSSVRIVADRPWASSPSMSAKIFAIGADLRIDSRSSLTMLVRRWN